MAGERRAVVHTHDAGNFCTENDVFVFRQKSLFLCKSYKLALQFRGTGEKMWSECANLAGEAMNEHSFMATSSGQVIQHWNRLFNRHGTFPHPRPEDMVLGKRWQPVLFQLYPEAKSELKSFCKENLATLSIEKAADYVKTVLLPNLKVDEGNTA
jgi:hypothetical protein